MADGLIKLICQKTKNASLFYETNRELPQRYFEYSLFPFLKESVIGALNTLIQAFVQAKQQTAKLIQ
jgi:hypothetical protein